MERFYKRKAPEPGSGNNLRNSCLDDLNWEEEIKYDPGLRKQIDDYHPNHRESVRRKYLENRPCQPRTLDFPVTYIGGAPRRFVPEWFDEFDWLEYSESKDRAYCFCCFLFRDKKDAGYEAFVKNGWNTFHKKERLRIHVGDVGGAHYVAMKKCDDLLQRNQHIDVAFHSVSESSKKNYLTRLNGSIDVARILLQQGLSFRGHDESKESLNKGNFREFRNFAAEQNPALRKAIGTSGSDNSLLIAPEIQRDIVHCFAKEVLHSILEEIGDDVFCLLVDESRDVSWKEQMAVVLRYVDKCGIVKERFVGLVHVTETTSAHLKSVIDALLANLKLSLKQVRGQGYDGASNMRDVKDDDRFFNLQTVAELSQKMVETRKHERYPLVYRLMKLVLVLPVATATVERIFSGMKIVKTNLRNRIGDEFMNNCLLCYVEKEEMMKVTNNAVVRRFMKMQGRRYQDED